MRTRIVAAMVLGAMLTISGCDGPDLDPISTQTMRETEPHQGTAELTDLLPSNLADARQKLASYGYTPEPGILEHLNTCGEWCEFSAPDPASSNGTAGVDYLFKDVPHGSGLGTTVGVMLEFDASGQVNRAAGFQAGHWQI